MNPAKPLFSKWQTKSAFAIWMVALVTGYLTLTGFSSTPGDSADAPREWSGSPAIASSGGKPLLIVAIHPKCMCPKSTASAV